MARLFASVAPAVKTISLGEAQIALAMVSRASSRAISASSPSEWSDDGLPNFSVK